MVYEIENVSCKIMRFFLFFFNILLFVFNLKASAKLSSIRMHFSFLCVFVCVQVRGDAEFIVSVQKRSSINSIQ